MTTVESIKAILSEQVKSYKMLVALLQKERACLLDLKASEIEELAKEKDNLAMQLRLLEEERVRLMGAYAAGTSLRKLSELSGDATVLDLRSTLISLVQSV